MRFRLRARRYTDATHDSVGDPEILAEDAYSYAYARAEAAVILTMAGHLPVARAEEAETVGMLHRVLAESYAAEIEP